METRGEDEEIGTPNSPLCYNNPSSNRESSTKLPNSDNPFLTTSADRRRDHTVPQLHFSHHHKLNLHHIHKQHTRDHPEATPDPPIQPSISASPPSAVTPPLPIASSRLISRTPPFPGATDNSIPSSVIRYRECLKNHAASTGGHVLDGCGEFMPNGEDGTPEALKCAACECHRNFHRKEMKDDPPSQQALPSGFFISNSIRNNGHRTDRTPVVPVSRHHQLPAVPISSMMMAFGGGSNGAPDESSSEDLCFKYYINEMSKVICKRLAFKRLPSMALLHFSFATKPKSSVLQATSMGTKKCSIILKHLPQTQGLHSVLYSQVGLTKCLPIYFPIQIPADHPSLKITSHLNFSAGMILSQYNYRDDDKHENKLGRACEFGVWVQNMG